MGVEILEASEGLLMVRVTGTLKKSELERAQAATAQIIRTHGRVRLLVIAEDFRGWERGADWSDVSFEMEHDEQIEKIAIVGDQEWEDLSLAFVGKGLLPATIEYFPPSDLARARAWVGAKPSTGIRLIQEEDQA
jgi:hypothetical protein